MLKEFFHKRVHICFLVPVLISVLILACVCGSFASGARAASVDGAAGSGSNSGSDNETGETNGTADQVIFSLNAADAYDVFLFPNNLYPDWYSDSWGRFKVKNGLLEFGGVFMRRVNYSNYCFSGEVGAARGSAAGIEKAYLLLRQPAGFGTDARELGLGSADGRDGSARPGLVGILVGINGTALEIVIHTSDESQTSGVWHDTYSITLPEGLDFSKQQVNFELTDRGDKLELRLDGAAVISLSLAGTETRTVNDWSAAAYTSYTLTDATGTVLGSGSNALIPVAGTVGFLGRGVVCRCNNLKLTALGNADDSVSAPVFFDEARILLPRGEATYTVKKIFGTPEICICIIAAVLAIGITAAVLLLSRKKGVRIAVSALAVLAAAAIVTLTCTGILNFSGTKKAPTAAQNTEPGKAVLDADGNTPARVLVDDNTATDMLGRRLPTYEETGPAKYDRYAGVFYTLWTCGANSLSDNTKNIAQNPDNPAVGPYASFHWFTEPETGYATSMDEWVVRRNLRYLSLAGVDYIYLDFTNGGIYEDAFKLLLDTSLALRAEGNATPAIVTWAYGSDTGTMEDAGYLYRQFYSREEYRELWFYIDGKPLILLKRVEEDIAAQTYPKTYLPVLYNEQFTNFFTTRFAWVPSETDHGTYPGQPVYRWSWCNPLFMHNYKEGAIAYSWDEDPAVAEQITIIGGSYCDIGYGRSGEHGTLDQFREKEVSGEGLYLEEQFEWTMQNHPEVQYLQISGWNEWIAQYFEGTGSFGFVDSYNREFSRDLAPIRGGYGDNYFYQLCSIIRRFKGLEPGPEAGSGSVSLTDSFEQWNGLGADYADFTGDTLWRDSTDTTGTIAYIDHTGRNDIAACKTVCDGSYIYFYVDTAEPLQGQFEPNWMLLFVDVDNDVTTGFEGYDRLINYALIDGGTTAVCAYLNNAWQEIGTAEYRTEGNKLMIKAGRSLLGQTGAEVRFGFHWLDNVTNIYDLSDWFLTGDSAPERRARYTFCCACGYDATGEQLPPARDNGKVEFMPALSGPEEAEAQSGTFTRILYNLSANYGKQPELWLLSERGRSAVNTIDVSDIPHKSFAAEFDGWIYVSASDIYDFTLKADDGAVLYIDGRKTVDISGVHTVTEGSGHLPLAAGYHKLRIEYFENGNGGSVLTFEAHGRTGGEVS